MDSYIKTQRMKFLACFLSFVFLFVIEESIVAKNIVQEGIVPAQTAKEILTQTAQKLNACIHLRYHHQRDYFTGDKHFLLDGNSFFDFHSIDSVVHLKYHFASSDFEEFYNGSESFSLDKKRKKIAIYPKPTKEDLESSSFLYNSLVTLRGTLPELIADESIGKTLSDTLIEGESYYQIAFSLYKKSFNNLGGYSPITEERTFTFHLIINQTSFWPYCLLQTNNVDEHTCKTMFTNVETNLVQTNEAQWYYSTYLKEYKQQQEEKRIALPIGSKMPSFQLLLFENDKQIHVDQLKGKVQVIEFWIRNCGPCIESVPILNAWQEQYSSKGLHILAVNAYDKKEVIASFVEKYKPAYAILYDGEKVAKQFGVDGFPMVFVIDKKGIIKYAGAFNKGTIEKVFQKLL